MGKRVIAMALGRIFAIALFCNWLQGSRGQLGLFPDVLSSVYDEGLNTEEWANWSFDFQGAGGFFFVNFHSFKAFEGSFGHFLPDATIVNVFSNANRFNEPGPLLEAPEPFVWTTYMVQIGPFNGQSIEFYNQSPHTNCFALDEMTVFDTATPSPPGPPPPPPSPPLQTIVLDINEGGLQTGFTFHTFGIADSISDGFSQTTGDVGLGPFGLLNIVREGNANLAVGPAIITVIIVQVGEPLFAENINTLDFLTIDVSLFNFASFGPSVLVDTQSLVNFPVANLPREFTFEIPSPFFSVDGINFKSQVSSGAQEFQISSITLLTPPQ